MARLQWRAALPEDEAFVNELTESTMRTYVEATWPDDPGAHEHYFSINKFDLPNTRIIMLGAERVGRLSTTTRSDYIFIDELHIVPMYQRRGLGEQAIRKVLSEAAAVRLPVKLTVLAVNPAQRLYRRIGFTVVVEIDHRLHMEYVTEQER